MTSDRLLYLISTLIGPDHRDEVLDLLAAERESQARLALGAAFDRDALEAAGVTLSTVKPDTWTRDDVQTVIRLLKEIEYHLRAKR